MLQYVYACFQREVCWRTCLMTLGCCCFGEVSSTSLDGTVAGTLCSSVCVGSWPRCVSSWRVYWELACVFGSEEYIFLSCVGFHTPSASLQSASIVFMTCRCRYALRGARHDEWHSAHQGKECQAQRVAKWKFIFSWAGAKNAHTTF